MPPLWRESRVPAERLALAVDPVSRGELRVPGLFSHAGGTGACCERSRAGATEDFPADVGFVSVYSRSDGIVDWRACLHPAASNVAVNASHCGMAAHADTYRVVARA